ncbi:MAG: plastocyanin/azurin family copper-binding protein [Blastococcus sp.]
MPPIRIHRTLPRLATGAALLALGLGGLTACGGSGSGSDSAAGSTSQTAASSSPETSASGSSTNGSAEAITATEQDFSISLDEDNLKAGSYTITVVNKGSSSHDLAVEEHGTTKATSDMVGPGKKTTLTVDLDAGEYTFYCSVDNHRAMGMEKTVKVSS